MGSRGNCSSTHFVSCRRTISGRCSASHGTRRARRARTEFTFQEAMRMQAEHSGRTPRVTGLITGTIRVVWLALALQTLVGDSLAAGLRPLVEAHCVECHAGPEPEGELDLAGLLADPTAALAERRETLATIREVLRADDMPPAREPRPPVELVESALAVLERALGPVESGPRMRRLNRARYEHAVRDLFGVAYPARELFPPDDVGARFDSEAAS